ncbi:MAG: hypothetical protein ACYCT7_09310 [bacterium]
MKKLSEKIQEVKSVFDLKIKQERFNYLIVSARFLPIALAILSVVFTSSYAHASTSSGSEFTPILTLVTGWIMGVPGILAAIAIVLTGIFTALSKGAMALFISLIIAGAIFTVPAIATGIATSLGGAIF